jgi:hypothetical protein
VDGQIRPLSRPIAGVAAAVLALAAPAAAAAFSKAIWGPVTRNGVNQFPLYRQLGVSIYEADLPWAEVAPRRPVNPTDPSDPAYRWPAQIQRAIIQAKRFHMRVLLQIIGAPGWANGGHDWHWAPRHPRDYAAFATAAAREYPSVHLWMVWGEPNNSLNFAPLSGARPGAQLNSAQKAAPHLYARILDATYAALKRASRANLVIGGNTYTTGAVDTQQWIQNLRLPGGKPPRMDLYGHNPFSREAPDFSDPPSPFGEVQFSDLPRMAGWIDRYLRRGLPIFLSEWTIPTGPSRQFDFSVSPKLAAGWITDAMRLSRRWKRIYGLGWVGVYDEPGTPTGLLTASGQRKPGFAAFARG